MQSTSVGRGKIGSDLPTGVQPGPFLQDRDGTFFDNTSPNLGAYSYAAGAPPPVPPVATTGAISINAGGAAVANFVADIDFSGGQTITNWTGAINTSLVPNPAPQAVYQSERYGAMTYTIPGLQPGITYVVVLHFAENFSGTSCNGCRLFNVNINGVRVLTNFDIYLSVGSVAHKAISKTFNATANNAGKIVIDFIANVQSPLINGLEVKPNSTKCFGDIILPQ